VGEKSSSDNNGTEGKKGKTDTGKQSSDKRKGSSDGNFLNDDGWIEDENDINDKKDLEKTKNKTNGKKNCIVAINIY